MHVCSENAHWCRLCVFVYTEPQQLPLATCGRALPRVCCGSKQSLWAHRKSGTGGALPAWMACSAVSDIYSDTFVLNCRSNSFRSDQSCLYFFYFSPLSFRSPTGFLFSGWLAVRCPSAPVFTATPAQLQAPQHNKNALLTLLYKCTPSFFFFGCQDVNGV